MHIKTILKSEQVAAMQNGKGMRMRRNLRMKCCDIVYTARSLAENSINSLCFPRIESKEQYYLCACVVQHLQKQYSSFFLNQNIKKRIIYEVLQHCSRGQTITGIG